MERLWESARCELELEPERDRGEEYVRNLALFHVATWRKLAERLMSHSATSNPLTCRKHSDKLVLLKQIITRSSLHVKITTQLELTSLTATRRSSV